MSSEHQAVATDARSNPKEVEPLRAAASSEQLARVLIIEDDEAVADGIRMLLEQYYDVEVAVGGVEGLRLLATPAKFDAILCDVMMPGVSGMEVYRQIRKLDPELARRVIFMTGGAYTEEADEFLDRVDNAQVQKPFNLHVLNHQLRLVIAKSN